MGLVLFALGKKNEALREYRIQLAFNEQAVSSNPGNLELRRNLSVAHHQVGWVLLAQGKFEEALVEFQADLAIIRDIADRDPTNKGWQRDLDVAYGMVGDGLIAQGNVQEAIRNYKTRLSLAGGLSEFLCVRRFPSCEHEALFEHNGELRLRLEPLARRPFPVRSRVIQDQI